MAKTQESLPDYVRRIRSERGLSCMDVQTRSARAGRKIAASYVNRIENGVGRRPSNDRLLALAHGLGVPEEELLTVARGAVPAQKEDAEEMRLTMLFRDLSEDRRRVILSMVETFHREHSSEPEVKPDGRKKRKTRVA
jgi:transcriptional regulator with XRE-family HTH domain